MAKAPAAKAGAGAASTIKAAIARPRAVLNESTIPLPNCRSAPNLRQRSFQLGECAVEMRRGGRTITAEQLPPVVPAKAGTQTAESIGGCTLADGLRNNNGLWLWTPAFAGATTERSRDLSPSRGLQRLRRVDIEERAFAVDRHFGDRLGVLGDEVSRADIAVQRQELAEEAARPQHGVAAAAFGDGHDDQIAAIRIEGLDQAVEQIGVDQRHVAEADHGAIRVLDDGSDARLDRACDPAGEIRIAHEFDFQ